jgi:hypothetical protein
MRIRNLPALATVCLGLAIFCTPAVHAQLLDFDDFESYAVGSGIAGQGSWDTWDGAAGVDSDVVDTYNSTVGGDRCIELTPADDVVRIFGGLTSGAFSFTSNVYIPSGQAGDYYFILMNTYDGSGSGYDWSGQIHMSDATGVCNADNISGGGGTFGDAPLVYDAWTEVRVDVDLDANLYQAYYNNVQIVTDGVWFGAGGQQSMQCLDLYNAGGGQFYYDDVQVSCIGSCGCLPFDAFNCNIDCATNDVTMDWTTFLNVPGGYGGGIQVLRNGVVLDTLPGDALFYDDLNAPLGLNEYQIIGDCTGGSTTTASCIVACTGGPCPPPVAGDECCDAFPAVSGANAFDLEFMTDSPDPVAGGNCTGSFLGGFYSDMWFTYTANTNAFLRISTCNSIDTDLAIYEASGACGTKIDVACNGDSCGVSSDLNFSCTAGTTYIVRLGSWDDPQAGAILTGDLVIEELCDFGLTGVIGIVDCGTGDVALGWNPAGFSNYDVLRDGVVLASALPFGTTAYDDIAAPPGPHVYEIVGNCTTQGTSVVTEVNVNVQGGGGYSDIIVIGEAVSGIDSAAALQLALEANGLVVDILPGGPADLPCITDASLERLWYIGGTYPAARALTAADGVAIVIAQSAGKHIYVEGGDIWGFDAATEFNLIDGISDTVADGGDNFLIMDGLDTGSGLDVSDLLDIAYNQDQATGNDWTDELQTTDLDSLGPNSALVWEPDAQAFGAGVGTGVLYDTDSGGKVLSQSWEFGGFGGDQVDLAGRYVGVLGGGPSSEPQFRRGDKNMDGGFNIADEIYLLAALFSGGAPCACPDACDENDDGAVNIADAIFGLAALFSGGAAPPAPGPNTCGEDPTPDSLAECVYTGAC